MTGRGREQVLAHKGEESVPGRRRCQGWSPGFAALGGLSSCCLPHCPQLSVGQSVGTVRRPGVLQFWSWRILSGTTDVISRLCWLFWKVLWDSEPRFLSSGAPLP